MQGVVVGPGATMGMAGGPGVVGTINTGGGTVVNTGGVAMGRGGGGGGFDCGCGPGQSCATCGAGCGVGEQTNVLSYVGAGGDYSAETTYKYVGAGAGDFSVVSVPTSLPNYCWCIIPILLLWALVALWLSRPRPRPPLKPPGKCMFWGDPHFWTFDNQMRNQALKLDAYPNGDFWIVQTPNVWIQGRYRPTKWLMQRNNDRACARAIAFGGPFMQNNKFIIEAMEKSTKSTTSDGQITYNGMPVLTTFPSTFNQGPVSARYHNQAAALDVRMHMPLHIVDVDLPENIHVQVDRWTEHIDGQITMSPIEGMRGHCGDFNGNPNNDQSAKVDSAGAHYPLLGGPVSPSQLLFPPTTFIDQHNFPRLVPEAGTYESRTR